jgi:hypothetical protein
MLGEKELADRSQRNERQFREPQAVLEVLPQHLPGHDQLVVGGAEQFGGAAGLLLLILVAPGKADREGMEARRGIPGHQCSDKCRIDPAAEIEADRHIGAKAKADRLVELGEYDLCRVRCDHVARLGERLGAVFRDFGRPVANDAGFECLQVDDEA